MSFVVVMFMLYILLLQMCVKFPAILKPLTLNVSELIAQAKDDGVSHAHGGGAAGSR